MKVLVTGSSGFIGSHLCRYLRKQGVEVLGTVRNQEETKDGVKRVVLDLLEKDNVEKVILDFKPDVIFHLAGQTLVMPSWGDPEQTFKTNIFTTLYILETVVKFKLESRVVIFSSAAIYDSSTKKIDENSKLSPNSPYGLSKITVDYLASLYSKGKKVDTVRIRPFFIVGPGKTSDVISDFAKRIIEIENGVATGMKVGNLRGVRDFVDIEDAISAIWLIAQKGNSGEVYNLSSGKGVRIAEVLNMLISLSRKKIKIISDKKLYRPIDEDYKVGNNSKLTKLGWKQKITLIETLEKTLNFWRVKKP